MTLALPSRLAALAAALLCAAGPLAAQDRPAQTLIPVASTPDGIEISVDSAALRRTGDSTFLVADASADVTRRMHFTPAKVNGQPVAVWATLPVTFGFAP